MRHTALRILALPMVFLACRREDPVPLRPVTVVAAPVERRDVPVVLRATGTVEPVQTAAVAAQVDGIIEAVTFREGDEVAPGQVLFRLDPRPYAAALAQAQGVLARDRAQYANAELDRARFEELAAKEFVTAQQLDQARATSTGLAATLQADSAAAARARLDLDRATVRAPIGGRAGSVLVRAGNLVRSSAGQALVLLNQMAPIRVRFALPATELGSLRRAGRGLPVRAMPVGDSGTAESGTLSFVDNAVDSLTGTILLKAEFPNRDRALWPGALVRVDLTVAVEKGGLVVPVGAVLTGQQGATVFVLADSHRVELRSVVVERTADRYAVLSRGVELGDSVVTDGQVRLTDGARVELLKPAPAESAR
jgi:multidrug efflux system membrane fusion protein